MCEKYNKNTKLYERNSTDKWSLKKKKKRGDNLSKKRTNFKHNLKQSTIIMTLMTQADESELSNSN